MKVCLLKNRNTKIIIYIILFFLVVNSQVLSKVYESVWFCSFDYFFKQHTNKLLAVCKYSTLFLGDFLLMGDWIASLSRLGLLNHFPQHFPALLDVLGQPATQVAFSSLIKRIII